MWTLFSISLGLNKAEFSVRGVVNHAMNCAKFQALCNGGVFAEGLDYEEVRAQVMDAVEINKANTDGLQ